MRHTVETGAAVVAAHEQHAGTAPRCVDAVDRRAELRSVRSRLLQDGPSVETARLRLALGLHAEALRPSIAAGERAQRALPARRTPSMTAVRAAERARAG